MRVTKADLESKVLNLARITGRDLRLSGAYGGYTVEDVKTGQTVISHGHIKAAELSMRIAVYVDGYCQAKDDFRDKSL